MNQVLTTCFNCKIDFFKSKKEFNRNQSKDKRHFCSRECYIKMNTTGKLVACRECNKNVWKKQSEIQNSTHIFCSRSCSITFNNRKRKGEKHPLWAGGINEYRNLAFENFKPVCNVCGYSTKDVLQVHHIDKNRKNNSLNNLIILCPNHHSEVHLGILTLPTNMGEK